MKTFLVVLALSVVSLAQSNYKPAASRALEALKTYQHHVHILPDPSTQREMELAADEADKLVDRAAHDASTDQDKAFQQRVERYRDDIEDMRQIVEKYIDWQQRSGSMYGKYSKQLIEQFNTANLKAYAETPYVH